ncbi:hypothetical protein BDA96_09G237000 [Sorghum bicolor]|uniref:DUF7812 domain-containing protein n=1 Tax=Sorghum bicolor TaxID=4558 RepID=A0A921QBY6_SORBI|nr:hypothetical protein BDA96_09G237000 [Sorghum bicolor]
MPVAKELEAARRVATLTLAELEISSSTSPPCSNLPALLRRCLRLLPLLNAGDPRLAARCCRGLLASLHAILSRDPSPSLLPAIEAFAESFVSSKQLMTCLVIGTYAAPEGSKVFTEAPPREDKHVMLELVCRHFISSLQDDGAFEVFVSALSWSGKVLQQTPEISFQGALVLVQRTCFFSLPAVVQGHLLLLMSRCTRDQNLDMHMVAFQYAMELYVRYLPTLCVFNRTGGAKGPQNDLDKKRPYKSYIKDTTEQKLRSQIDCLLLFCKLHSGDDLPISVSDIGRVIEENQHMFHEKFRQQCTVDVKSILSSILCCAKQKEVLEPDAEVSDEIICLAAALRVMGSSMQHILHHFRQMRSAADKKHNKEYNVIYEIISSLRQYETNELHRYDLAITGKCVDRESASVLMFTHFATVSTSCLRRRLGFLWKGCIIMMMMATNLIAEEESLSTFDLPMDVPKESAVLCNTKVGISEVSARTKEIILQYNRFRDKGRHFYADGISLGTPEECNSRVGKANGQRFFECHPEYSGNSWDDILDCVECEEGKDYSNALKQQQKFKVFKYGMWLNQRQAKRQSTMDTLGLKSKRRTSMRRT